MDWAEKFVEIIDRYYWLRHVLASFIVSLFVFLRGKESGIASAVVNYFDFIHFGSFKIPFAFQIDQLSSIFLIDHYRRWFSDPCLFYFVHA